ncbi:hypothetical protein, variant [Fonticula alba]|uniref:DUF1275 domain-containing protein n=1 Tax=Fonticula alba TaxID=691883 RepID=A0A058ZDW8_FONAL|nr:hypothetical protein, variant [Fonticula alba]KCV71657.1 hypothetical protein, variant [Fonticula alba]|eukprot:XP_009493234.1 hypothetical protein, variant [Fonticula alba]
MPLARRIKLALVRRRQREFESAPLDIHTQRDFYPVLIGGVSLTLLAGFINAVFVTSIYQRPVSHMTGPTTNIAIQMTASNVDLIHLWHYGLLVFFFICGSMCSGLIIGSEREFRLDRSYGWALIVQATALFLGAILPTLGSAELPVFFGAFACGLQNALVTTFSSAIIRTTHITGIVSDIGVLIGQNLHYYFFNGPPQKGSWKLKLFIPLYLGFFGGAALGAMSERAFKMLALLFPAGLLLIMGVFHLSYRTLLKKIHERRFENEERFEEERQAMADMFAAYAERFGNDRAEAARQFAADAITAAAESVARASGVYDANGARQSMAASMRNSLAFPRSSTDYPGVEAYAMQALSDPATGRLLEGASPESPDMSGPRSFAPYFEVHNDTAGHATGVEDGSTTYSFNADTLRTTGMPGSISDPGYDHDVLPMSRASIGSYSARAASFGNMPAATEDAWRMHVARTSIAVGGDAASARALTLTEQELMQDVQALLHERAGLSPAPSSAGGTSSRVSMGISSPAPMAPGAKLDGAMALVPPTPESADASSSSAGSFHFSSTGASSSSPSMSSASSLMTPVSGVDAHLSADIHAAVHHASMLGAAHHIPPLSPPPGQASAPPSDAGAGGFGGAIDFSLDEE